MTTRMNTSNPFAYAQQRKGAAMFNTPYSSIATVPTAAMSGEDNQYGDDFNFVADQPPVQDETAAFIIPEANMAY